MSHHTHHSPGFGDGGDSVPHGSTLHVLQSIGVNLHALNDRLRSHLITSLTNQHAELDWTPQQIECIRATTWHALIRGAAECGMSRIPASGAASRHTSQHTTPVKPLRMQHDNPHSALSHANLASHAAASTAAPSSSHDWATSSGRSIRSASSLLATPQPNPSLKLRPTPPAAVVLMAQMDERAREERERYAYSPSRASAAARMFDVADHHSSPHRSSLHPSDPPPARSATPRTSSSSSAALQHRRPDFNDSVLYISPSKLAVALASPAALRTPPRSQERAERLNLNDTSTPKRSILKALNESNGTPSSNAGISRATSSPHLHAAAPHSLPSALSHASSTAALRATPSKSTTSHSQLQSRFSDSPATPSKTTSASATPQRYASATESSARHAIVMTAPERTNSSRPVTPQRRDANIPVTEKSVHFTASPSRYDSVPSTPSRTTSANTKSPSLHPTDAPQHAHSPSRTHAPSSPSTHRVTSHASLTSAMSSSRPPPSSSHKLPSSDHSHSQQHHSPVQSDSANDSDDDALLSYQMRVPTSPKRGGGSSNSSTGHIGNNRGTYANGNERRMNGGRKEDMHATSGSVLSTPSRSLQRTPAATPSQRLSSAASSIASTPLTYDRHRYSDKHSLRYSDSDDD